MVLIPKYLREIAETVENKAEKLTVRIKCPCGCDKFFVLKNIIKRIFNNALFRANNEWYEMIHSDYPYPYSGEADQSVHFWGGTVFAADGWYYRIATMKNVLENKYDYTKVTPVKELFFSYNRPKNELPINPRDPRLDPDTTLILKGVCASCNKEHLLLDDRIHGDDAREGNPDGLDVSKLKNYAFKRKKLGDTNEPAELFIKIINSFDFDNLGKYRIKGLTADNCSERFQYITIKAVTAAKKKLIVCSEQLC